MRLEYRERQAELAQYIIDHRCTVRQAAAWFGVSKSTVHKDVTEKLAKTHPLLSEEVKRILAHNKAERHLRGGEATRKKYLGKKACKSEASEKNQD